MKKSPLEKRIKRRVTARRQKFFASCSPGLKKLAYNELRRLPLELDDLVMVSGGVEFSGRVHDGYLANLLLGSPSRISMRLAGFKAENFRTLENKLKAVEWELYFSKGAQLSVEVSTHRSRLYHTGAVSQRADTIIGNYLNGLDDTFCIGEKPGSHTLFIRGDRDLFTLSLDSSGELLYKRGVKRSVGRAPLRENLAFALLQWTGYSGSEPLVDPMCGSGSFILEAAMIRGRIPPGWFRRFAFEDWPCFNKKQWRFLKKEAGRRILLRQEPVIAASDQDGALLDSLENGLSEYGLGNGIRIFQHDFFDLMPAKLTREKGVVVLNPPYGRRLGEEKRTKSFYREIGRKLGADFKGWRAGIILPDKELLYTLGFKGVSLMPVFHGGLDLYAAVFTIN